MLDVAGKHDPGLCWQFLGQRFDCCQSDPNGSLQWLKTDTHSPGEYRSDTVRNVDGWYETYKVAPGEKLYLKPEDRVRIW